MVRHRASLLIATLVAASLGGVPAHAADGNAVLPDFRTGTSTSNGTSTGDAECWAVATPGVGWIPLSTTVTCQIDSATPSTRTTPGAASATTTTAPVPGPGTVQVCAYATAVFVMVGRQGIQDVVSASVCRSN